MSDKLFGQRSDRICKVGNCWKEAWILGIPTVHGRQVGAGGHLRSASLISIRNARESLHGCRAIAQIKGVRARGRRREGAEF